MSERTCGNCFHCVPRHGTRWYKRDGVCLYCGEAVDTQSMSPICPCGNHRMWRERINTPEQRYEKLADITRNLYELSSDLLENCGRSDCFHLRIARTNLKELGINVVEESDA